MRKLTSENGIKKGPWTAEEDRKLIQYVQTHGPGKWRTVPKNAGLQRCGKSCRLRWTNYLRPDIKRGRFSFEEEETIIQLHSVLGNKWSAIAARLPGRTDNEIKNYWNTHIRKKLHHNRVDHVTSTLGTDRGIDLFKLSSILNSTRFNLSNLINLQTLLNPQILRLATILASLSNNENHELFLNNHINPVNPNVNQKNPNFASCPSNHSNTVFYQSHLMQANDIQYLQENLTNISGDTSQDILTSACLADDYSTISNYNNQATAQASDSFQPSYTENGIPSPSSQKFDYCSVLSSPISSPTPLTSPTTFINNSGTDVEGESYWSNMFKLDI